MHFARFEAETNWLLKFSMNWYLPQLGSIAEISFLVQFLPNLIVFFALTTLTGMQPMSNIHFSQLSIMVALTELTALVSWTMADRAKA